MTDSATFLDHAPVAMALVRTPDDRIEIANAAFAQALDAPSRTLSGRRLAELFADPEAIEEQLRLVRDGSTTRGSRVVTSAGGNSLLLTAWPVNNAADAVGVLLTADTAPGLEEAGGEGDAPGPLSDTLREVNEALLISALEEHAQAEEARSESEAKSVFLASVSHELRTPLNSIIGYADLLDAGVPEALPEGLESHVERIRTAARHLLSIIEQIIEASRAEFGHDLETETVDLTELLPEVLDLVRARAESADIELQLDLPGDPLEAEIDRRKLQQVLLNLLVNAIKFTHDGYVRLELDEADAAFRIRVIDSGIGIDEQEQKQVFRRFWQSGGSPVRTQGGMGIGLWVVRTLVEAMAGDITLESAPGRGSTFEVTLPKTPPQPRDGEG